MDALEAAKDVIRRKYAQLKIDTAEVINRAAKAETDVVEETTSASDEEKRIRELSKLVSKKENELDVEQVKIFKAGNFLKHPGILLYHLESDVSLS